MSWNVINLKAVSECRFIRSEIFYCLNLKTASHFIMNQACYKISLKKNYIKTIFRDLDSHT